MLSWIKKRLAKRYKLNKGDLVQDIGDTFAKVEDPGIVVQLFEDRYTYRHPLFFGLLKIKIDGITVRWLDKKGSSHIYPACCVKKMELTEERAAELRTTAKSFDSPEKDLDISKTDEQIEIDWNIPSEPSPLLEPEEEPEEEEKPALGKMQEKLREVQRIIEERKKKDEEEGGEE